MNKVESLDIFVPMNVDWRPQKDLNLVTPMGHGLVLSLNRQTSIAMSPPVAPTGTHRLCGT